MAAPEDKQLPVAVAPVKVKRQKAAGGLAAVLNTAQQTRKMGIIRGVKTLLRVNQEDGFDCPGCAWPDPEQRGRIEFCENGAKAVAHEATKRRVTAAFFAEWSIDKLLQRSDRWLEAQGRLTEPMVREPGSDRYVPISWEDAFARIAEAIHALDSPNQAVFYTSGRTSNEAAFLYQLMVRQLGTNNLPDCSNLCHESSGKALTAVLGVGKGTVGLEDFELADAIFVVGQNPGTNHPRMLTALEDAAKRGCRIISINPLREAGLVRFKHPKRVLDMLGRGTAIAEQFLQVRVNGDVALFKGLCKAVLEAEAENAGSVLDHDFIHRHTTGFDEYAKALKRTNWAEITEGSGVSRKAIKQAAQVYIESDRTIICWAMGLTQHKNAVANIQELVNLLLLGGNMGKPGAGACPVRGHSNVQGDRTMGICEAPSPALLSRLGEAFGFEPPTAHGFDSVAAIRAMHGGQARFFMGLGGNFVAAAPDTELTKEALRRCDLTVQVSTKLNRSHLVTGEAALILPCLARSEVDVQASAVQFVTVENSMSIVHRSRGHLAPASEHLRSEPAIVAGLAAALLGEWAGSPERGTHWRVLGTDYDRIRDRISQVIPGFEDFNSRIREPGWLQLPNCARERRFETSKKRARFTVHPIPDSPLRDGQLMMMTIRSHDQYNTTVYSDNDRYRGIHGARRVVLMNHSDIEDAGLIEGQVVDLVSHHNGEQRKAGGFVVVPYDIPRRCAATYFPEANALVHVDSYADISHTPASKSVVITVVPAQTGSA